MISREGAVKLLDIGIARAEAAVRGDYLRAKAAYAAPEQLRGAAPDRRFDLWSLGVVLYELLTGRRPFEGDDLMGILRAAEAREYPAVAMLRPEVAPFEELITRALEPDPERRWLGAEAFRTACLRLGERFGLAKAADLGLLVERAGGSEPKDDVADISGTGVAALDAEALAALSQVEANRAAEQDTKPARTRARWPMVLLVVALSLALAGIASLFRGRPEVVEEPPILATPIEEPPPIEQPIEAPPPPAVQTVERDAGVARARTQRKKVRRRKPPPRRDPPTLVEGFGKLSVRTDPTWARLLLNGQPIGRTILYGKPFAPGTHRLQMLPGDDAFAALDTTVTIKPGVTTNVFANFQTGAIKVVER
jgi:hypothetical protein